MEAKSLFYAGIHGHSNTYRSQKTINIRSNTPGEVDVVGTSYSTGTFVYDNNYSGLLKGEHSISWSLFNAGHTILISEQSSVNQLHHDQVAVSCPDSAVVHVDICEHRRRSSSCAGDGLRVNCATVTAVTVTTVNSQHVLLFDHPAAYQQLEANSAGQTATVSSIFVAEPRATYDHCLAEGVLVVAASSCLCSVSSSSSSTTTHHPSVPNTPSTVYEASGNHGNLTMVAATLSGDLHILTTSIDTDSLSTMTTKISMKTLFQNIFTVFKTIRPSTVTDLLMFPQGNDCFVCVTFSDYTLKIFSCKKQKLLFSKNLVESETTETFGSYTRIASVENTLIQKRLIGVHVVTEDIREFKLFTFEASDSNVSLNSWKNISSMDEELRNFSMSSKSIFAILCCRESQSETELLSYDYLIDVTQWKGVRSTDFCGCKVVSCVQDMVIVNHLKGVIYLRELDIVEMFSLPEHYFDEICLVNYKESDAGVLKKLYKALNIVEASFGSLIQQEFDYNLTEPMKIDNQNEACIKEISMRSGAISNLQCLMENSESIDMCVTFLLDLNHKIRTKKPTLNEKYHSHTAPQYDRMISKAVGEMLHRRLTFLRHLCVVYSLPSVALARRERLFLTSASSSTTSSSSSPGAKSAAPQLTPDSIKKLIGQYHFLCSVAQFKISYNLSYNEVPVIGPNGIPQIVDKEDFNLLDMYQRVSNKHDLFTERGGEFFLAVAKLKHVIKILLPPSLHLLTTVYLGSGSLTGPLSGSLTGSSKTSDQPARYLKPAVTALSRWNASQGIDQPVINHITAVCNFEDGEFDSAFTLFKLAANGFADNNKQKSEIDEKFDADFLSKLVCPCDVYPTVIMAYYGMLIELFNSAKQYAIVLDLIFIVKTNTTDDVIMDCIAVKEFTLLLLLKEYAEAYGKLMEMDNYDSRLVNLRLLFTTMIKNGEVGMLINDFTFQGEYDMNEEFEQLLIEISKNSSLKSKHYEFLYCYYMIRGLYRKAAVVKYEIYVRARQELSGPTQLHLQDDCLLMVTTCLKSLENSERWINFKPGSTLSKFYKDGFLGSEFNYKRGVLSYEHLLQIRCLIESRVYILQNLDHFEVGESFSEVKVALLKNGMYDQATKLLKQFNEPMDELFRSLTSVCMNAFDKHAWLQYNKSGPKTHVYNPHKTVVDKAWDTLEHYLNSYDTPFTRYNNIIMNVLLRNNKSIPEWLVRSYKNSTGDLMTILVKYRLFIKAADVIENFVFDISENTKPLELFNQRSQLLPLNQVDSMLLELRQRCVDKNDRGESMVFEHKLIKRLEKSLSYYAKLCQDGEIEYNACIRQGVTCA